MDGMHRILVAGRNSSMSHTAAQDTAGSTPPGDEGMDLYMAYLYTRQAGEAFLTAHMMRDRDRHVSDLHHVNAMEQMDKLAETLGLELVARQNVAAS